MPYFFPFREHLANENDIIGSILGTNKNGRSHLEPHREPFVENDVSAKFNVEQQPLDMPNSLVATENPINKTSLANLRSTGPVGESR
jgi:hypothetical protein